jgi:ABC transporter, substrate-binding protein, aliphatic sulfonates family
MIKKSVIAVLTVCLLLSFIGCGAQTPPGASDTAQNDPDRITATKVRVATQPGVYAASILLAKVNGYFEEELEGTGVEVTWDSFPSGPPLNEAFAAGEEDIGLVGDVPLLIAKASGQPTLTFAKTSSGETTVALTVRPDSPIKTPEDLEGKKIAFVKGSYGHHFLSLVLAKAGLTLDDVEQVNLPNADIGNAVASGEVDAGVIWEPTLTSSLSSNIVVELIDATGLKSNSVFYFTTQSFAQENPGILHAYIRAVERAGRFIQENPGEAARLLQSEIKLDEAELAGLLEKFDYSPQLTGADIAELKLVEEFNRAQGFTTGTVDVDTFVSTQYLDNSGIG